MKKFMNAICWRTTGWSQVAKSDIQYDDNYLNKIWYWRLNDVVDSSAITLLSRKKLKKKTVNNRKWVSMKETSLNKSTLGECFKQMKTLDSHRKWNINNKFLFCQLMRLFYVPVFLGTCRQFHAPVACCYFNHNGYCKTLRTISEYKNYNTTVS